MIISMETNLPTIAADLEQFCIGCMHCVAICSEGSVSILGYGPEQGIELKGATLPSPEEMELLIKGRRSTRNYQDRNVNSKLIDKLVEVASHAPSGHNDRQLLYTLIDDKGIVYDLREEAFDGIEKLINDGELPEGMEMFVDIMNVWKANGKDILFRGAPHMLIVSASRDSASPLHDSIIALSTFDLYCASHGIGTNWNGLATLTISQLVPALKAKLGIPEDHEIGYVMGFGLPAIKFKRTISRGTPKINRIK
jgi:nitroreductase